MHDSIARTRVIHTILQLPSDPLFHHPGTAPVLTAKVHVFTFTKLEMELLLLVERLDADPVFLVQLLFLHRNDFRNVTGMDSSPMRTETGEEGLVLLKRQSDEVVETLETTSSLARSAAVSWLIRVLGHLLRVQVADKRVCEEELVQPRRVTVVLRLNEMLLSPLGVNSSFGGTSCKSAGQRWRVWARNERRNAIVR